MPRKKSKREPTPMEEGEQIIESAEKAGADYAQEQVGSPHFRDWVHDQLAEAERMRAADPSSVLPLETPDDAKKVARNMLKQLEWDTKRQMEHTEIEELSGASGVLSSGNAAWVKDTYGITAHDVGKSFFEGFSEELDKPTTREWLTDEILQAIEGVQGVGSVNEARGGVVRAAARTGMTPEQRETIVAALRHYGADLSSDGFIAHGEKVLGVRPEISKGRLRMVSKTGQLLASFPVANIGTGVADFVEKFWFWKPVTVASEVRETHAPLPTEEQIINYFLFDAEDVDVGTFSRAKTDEVAAHFGMSQAAAFRALDALAKKGVLQKTRDVMKGRHGKKAVGYQWWEYGWKSGDRERYESRSDGRRDDRPGIARETKWVDDPFYVIQGIYRGGSISDNFGGVDDGKIAIDEAKKFSTSPFFEGDYVRVITRDGELVWDSRGGEHGTWPAVSEARRHAVRDYIAVDPHGRPVAGPFTDYSDAKRAATRAAGYVKYATERTHRHRRTVR